MAYASRDDIERAYGANLLLLIADHDGDGETDDDVVGARLDDATSTIESYLGDYTLPLDPVPAFIRRYTVDIAVYTLPLSADLLTDEMRRRYEDAIKHLTLIASGKAGLGTATPGTGGGPTPVETTSGIRASLESERC